MDGDEDMKKEDVNETLTVIRFFIGNDKGHVYTPFDQFYVYSKDDIYADTICTQLMEEFKQEWINRDHNAGLMEVRNEFVSKLRISAGFWMEDFKKKSLCTIKEPYIPDEVKRAQELIKNFERQLEEEWVDIEKLDYEHTNDIYLDGDIFTVGDNEMWNDENLKHLLYLSNFLPLSIKKTSDDRGDGLFALDDISKNTVIGQYAGELLDLSDALSREDDTYQFWAGKEFKIDAKYKGNKTRFINHICNGKHSACNVAIDIIEDTGLEGFFRIIMYSKRKIYAGQELLFNYRSGVMKKLKGTYEENMHKIVCKCPCSSNHIQYPFVY